jgi:glutamate-ammonia-ligase adenylyltransferase
VEMRRRLLRDLPAHGPWDVKLRPGGLMEVEFVTQVLQLIHFAQRPECRRTTTRLALANLIAAGALDAAEGETLIAADHLWRTIMSMLRLTVGPTSALDLPEASARILLTATGALTMGDLHVTIARTAALVRAAFIRHIGDPGTPEAPPKTSHQKGTAA